MIPIRALVGASALFLCTASAFAGVTTPNGWQNAPVTAAPAFSFTGGMDVLPNGNVAVFDGTSVVEIDPANGNVVDTLFTPPPFTFGSFVSADPTGTYLLFGESSANNVYRVPLDGSPATVVANILFNYSCTFMAPDLALIVHGELSFNDTSIVLLHVSSGAIDTIAQMTGPSGGIALDNHGNLYYGDNVSAFPPPAGAQNVVTFSAAQVASAIGPGSLLENASTVFATGLSAPFSMAFDEEGDLFVSDSADAKIREYGSGGVFKSDVGVELGTTPFDSPAVSHLAFAGNRFTSPARMGAFQPANGGTLYALSSAFDPMFSVLFNDLNVIRPKRAHFEVAPANPVPVGPVTLTLKEGPPSGVAFLFIAGQAVTPEFAVVSGGVPFFFGIDFGQIATITAVPLDPNGEFSASGTHPGGGGSGVVQAVLFDAFTAPLGTSEALTITLQ
jgi:hypothetical protein